MPAEFLTGYTPGIVPVSLQKLPAYLDRELRRVGTVLQAQEDNLPVSVLLGQSTISQNPTAVGVAGAIFLTFGAAQGTPQDPVQLLADGTILFNQGGTYSIDTRYVFYRATQPGRARLVYRALVNGAQLGNPIVVIMDSPDFSSYEQYTVAGVLAPGTTLKWQLARDDGFENDGGVVSVATNLGWGLTPSALIRILKY